MKYRPNKKQYYEKQVMLRGITYKRRRVKERNEESEYG
jgi:hypothetical protein